MSTLRRFFCVCVLFFTINNQCSFALHTLLADVIDTCGGSKRLVRMFNRLGICSSSETALQYVQYHVKTRTEEGITSAYPSNCFMIASADNIDYVHHYARVYCGKQQSSWQGTTVQIVQPKPCTLTTNTYAVSGDASVPIHHMLRSHQLTKGKRLYSMRSSIKPTSPHPKK